MWQKIFYQFTSKGILRLLIDDQMILHWEILMGHNHYFSLLKSLSYLSDKYSQAELIVAMENWLLVVVLKRKQRADVKNKFYCKVGRFDIFFVSYLV